MDWKEIGAKVAQVAPTLGAAVGGPVGALAGQGVAILAKILGIDPEKVTPDKVAQALDGPMDEWKFKVLAAEYEFQVKMKDLELQEKKAELADVQSARDRQVEHEKATGKTDINLYVLAWVIVGGFLGLTAFLIYVAYTGKAVQDQTGVLYMLLGTLATSFGMVVGYFFGSSAGSSAKSKVLEQIAGRIEAKKT